MELKVLGEKEGEREDHGGGRKRKVELLRGFLYGEDGSVVVDLPSLDAQHAFILTELCFHRWGIFGLDIYRNKILLKQATATSKTKW